MAINIAVLDKAITHPHPPTSPPSPQILRHTQPPTLASEINNASTIDDPLPQEGIIKKTMVNSKRKQDDQLGPDQTKDTSTEDQNDTIMEDQSPITLPNQRTQTRFSSPNRRETRKKGPLVLPKTLSRLGKTRK